MKTKTLISPEKFVIAYLTCKSLKECSKKLGISLQAVELRSLHYRRKGVKLAKLPRTIVNPRKINVSALNRLITK